MLSLSMWPGVHRKAKEATRKEENYIDRQN
jgi:hypothetical protein